jgi:hypothetical protein
MSQFLDSTFRSLRHLGLARATAGAAVHRLFAQWAGDHGGRGLFTSGAGGISDRTAGDVERGRARYIFGCSRDVTPISAVEDI